MNDTAAPDYISNADVPRFAMPDGTLVVKAIHYAWLEAKLAKTEQQLEVITKARAGGKER